MLAQGIVGRELVEQKFAVADDYAEQVVEIMCHTTRQPSDRFHFLGLTQRVFHAFSFGDVTNHCRNTICSSRGIFDDGERYRDRDLPSVFACADGFELFHLFTTYHSVYKFLDFIRSLWRTKNGRGLADDFG